MPLFQLLPSASGFTPEEVGKNDQSSAGVDRHICIDRAQMGDAVKRSPDAAGFFQGGGTGCYSSSGFILSLHLNENKF